MDKKIKLIAALLLIFGSFFLPRATHADATVQINEINTSTGSDWIELYNPTSSDIDLTDYTIFDDTSNIIPTNSAGKKALTGAIAANGFVTIDVSNRLNNDGDQVHLKDPAGNDIDSYTYSTNPGAASFARLPDGGAWSILTPTKGASNSTGSPVATPTPTPTSSPTPTPTATPTASPASNFTISGVPTDIGSDDVFSAGVSLNFSANPNTIFYLKGAFYQNGSSNYFGQTLVAGSWIKNSATYSQQLKIVTDSSGNWSGLVQVKPDSADTGFNGTGSYGFKVARYNESGDLSWSNDTSINITAVANPSPAISNTTGNPPESSGSANPVNSFTTTGDILGASSSPKIATISAVSRNNPPINSKVSASHLYNWYFIGGILAILIGTSIFLINFISRKYSLRPLRFIPWKSKI